MVATTNYTTLLGDAGASYLDALTGLLSGIPDGSRYDFMSKEKFAALLSSDFKESQRIYWIEILYRAHFAAHTSLIRTSRWLDAMFLASEARNYTAFMAAYRGCLEAAADSFETFEHVPAWIADLHSAITPILHKTADQPSLFPDLENKLIHFTHARFIKKDEVVDEAQRMKHTTQYLQNLVKTGVPEVTECYRILCDVTHPGIGSVRCYADADESETGTFYVLRTDLDETLIAEFCDKYKAVSERMMQVSVIPPAVTLRVLNVFDIDTIRTEAVTRIGLENQPSWQPYAEMLASDAPTRFKLREPLPDGKSTRPVTGRRRNR